jgi:hypothetical protein
MQKVGTLIAEWGGKDPEPLVRALLRLGDYRYFLSPIFIPLNL